MPDFVTHSLFAGRMLEHSGRLAEYCRRYEPLYRLGAQGPDLLFYTSLALLIPRLYDEGEQLHALTAEQLERLAVEAPGGLERPVLAYICGYITHLELDGYVHPFICRLADQLSDSGAGSVGYCHVLVENRLEYLDCVERTGRAPHDYDISRDLPAPGPQSDAVCRVNSRLLEMSGLAALPRGFERRWLAAYGRFLKILFDRSGRPGRLAELLSRIAAPARTALGHLKRQTPPPALPDEGLYERFKVLMAMAEESCAARFGRLQELVILKESGDSHDLS